MTIEDKRTPVERVETPDKIPFGTVFRGICPWLLDVRTYIKIRRPVESPATGVRYFLDVASDAIVQVPGQASILQYVPLRAKLVIMGEGD